MSGIEEADRKALEKLLSIPNEDGVPVVMIGLLATLFLRESWTRPVREAVADVAEDYLQKFQDKLTWAATSISKTRGFYRVKSKPIPFPRIWLPEQPDGISWNFGWHGGKNKRAVSEFQIHGFGTDDIGDPNDLGFLSVYLPLHHFVDHPGTFPEFVLTMCKRIKPFHGYAGLGFLEPLSDLGRLDAQPIVASLAQRFPGVEVEDLTSHTLWCQNGIKGVNWLTILSDRFVQEAGGMDYLRIRLDEPNFPFYPYNGGLIIQAGAHPEIGDATRNRWPRHYVTLNKVLKKIQIKEHRPFHQTHHSPMLKKDASEAWLFRFDGK